MAQWKAPIFGTWSVKLDTFAPIVLTEKNPFCIVTNFPFHKFSCRLLARLKNSSNHGFEIFTHEAFSPNCSDSQLSSCRSITNAPSFLCCRQWSAGLRTVGYCPSSLHSGQINFECISQIFRIFSPMSKNNLKQNFRTVNLPRFDRLGFGWYEDLFLRFINSLMVENVRKMPKWMD